MTFELQKVVNRKNTLSIKWDETNTFFGREDVLPMWVADMDFQAPPSVTEAIKKRMEHGVYGYTSVPRSTSSSVVNWVARNHNWSMKEEWLTYISGVVPTLSLAVQTFSEVGDKIITFSPVYYPFFDMIQLNNRKLVTSSLVLKDGRYEFDLEDFESKLDDSVKMLLLCNPHNPGGTVWTKEELTRLGEMCLKHNILVVSDEIHGDLALDGYVYTPFASIDPNFSNNCITCIAPTKTFNIAGLQAAVIVIENNEYRKQVELFQKKNGHFTLNTFGIIGMEAAYTEGDEWLKEVKKIIESNVKEATSFIEKEMGEKLKVCPLESTYLLWIDCRGLGIDDAELKSRLLHKGMLALEMGEKFGPEGKGFVRMNIACPRETLLDGLNRLKTACK
ncbi:MULTISPECIES: MalY/PatB family protein [Bacillus]|uniref:MalY/PatB family protein n=1 Tax=Bacillus TaxID=1386 RepID=UPI001D0CE4F0|nr:MULTISPECIES: MalY/PatB family protein [Bacillus]